MSETYFYCGNCLFIIQENPILCFWKKESVIYLINSIIQIIAVVDAHFDPELQSKQLRSLKLLEPDILISIPTDTKITSQAYHEIASGKTKMIFMSNIPNGFKANDYVSCISVNERSHGRNIGRGLGRKSEKNAFDKCWHDET